MDNTQKQINENNILIAEFMGIENKNLLKNIIFIGTRKYHSSWDWLMPVVKKCYEINKTMLSHDLSVGIFANNHIDIVWNAVVKFIQWYNKNN